MQFLPCLLQHKGMQVSRNRLHDGDTFLIRGGENPLFVEYLDTNGRRAVRVTNRLGHGILLEEDCMGAFSVLLDTILDKPTPNVFDYFST